MTFIDIAVESHKARSIANKYFDSKLDSILKDVKEMKNLIRQKQWIDDYHKNNVGLLQIDQKKLLQEKRMLGVRVCLKSYESIHTNYTIKNRIILSPEYDTFNQIIYYRTFTILKPMMGHP